MIAQDRRPKDAFLGDHLQEAAVSRRDSDRNPVSHQEMRSLFFSPMRFANEAGALAETFFAKERPEQELLDADRVY
jgi:hypothetical protein